MGQHGRANLRMGAVLARRGADRQPRGRAHRTLRQSRARSPSAGPRQIHPE